MLCFSVFGSTGGGAFGSSGTGAFGAGKTLFGQPATSATTGFGGL